MKFTMKFTMKLKEFLNLKVILVLSLLCFGFGQAMAANRTFTVTAGAGGRAQYRIGDTGSFSDMPSNNKITVDDGQVLWLRGVANEGYLFYRWTGRTLRITPVFISSFPPTTKALIRPIS